MSAPSDEFSPAYTRYVLALLSCVTVLNVMDRQLMSILIEPIKAELGVSDTAMGLLTGLSFALLHSAAMIPVAIWADRGVRRSIIALGVGLWSLLTMLTGWAQGYAAMFAVRVGVGVGEASGTGPAQSLLSDYFPRERRATALALFVAGGPIGSMIAYAGGGWIGETLGWRAAFWIFGSVGLPVALLIRFSLREPRRGRTDPGSLEREPLPVRQAIATLLHTPGFGQALLASALNATGAYALLVWAAPFLMRVHGMGTAEAGGVLALGYALVNAVGVAICGPLTDRLARRDVRWLAWVPALSSIATAPFAWGFLLATEREVSLLWLLPTALLGGMYMGPIYAILQGLARPQVRALAASLVSLSNTVLGLAIGPVLVGALNDHLAIEHGASSVRYSLAVALLAHVWAAAHLVAAARSLRAGWAGRAS